MLYPLIILLEMSLTYNTDKHYAKITFILGNIIAYAMIFTIYIHYQTTTAKIKKTAFRSAVFLGEGIFTMGYSKNYI